MIPGLIQIILDTTKAAYAFIIATLASFLVDGTSSLLSISVNYDAGAYFQMFYYAAGGLVFMITAINYIIKQLKQKSKKTDKNQADFHDIDNF